MKPKLLHYPLMADGLTSWKMASAVKVLCGAPRGKRNTTRNQERVTCEACQAAIVKAAVVKDP